MPSEHQWSVSNAFILGLSVCGSVYLWVCLFVGLFSVCLNVSFRGPQVHGPHILHILHGSAKAKKGFLKASHEGKAWAPYTHKSRSVNNLLKGWLKGTNQKLKGLGGVGHKCGFPEIE